MPLFGKHSDDSGASAPVCRDPLFLAAAIFSLDRSSCPVVVDVTAKGARLRGCGELEAGQHLWIKVGVLDTLATVGWSVGDLCGITFDRALSDEDADHLRREARNMLVTQITADERQMALGWLTGSRA